MQPKLLVLIALSSIQYNQNGSLESSLLSRKFPNFMHVTNLDTGKAITSARQRKTTHALARMKKRSRYKCQRQQFQIAYSQRCSCLLCVIVLALATGREGLHIGQPMQHKQQQPKPDSSQATAIAKPRPKTKDRAKDTMHMQTDTANATHPLPLLFPEKATCLRWPTLSYELMRH